MLECLESCWKNVLENAKIYWKQVLWNSWKKLKKDDKKVENSWNKLKKDEKKLKQVVKRWKKVEKVEKKKKIGFRKFQNMMYQTNDLEKTHIKPNKATKN